MSIPKNPAGNKAPIAMPSPAQNATEPQLDIGHVAGSQETPQTVQTKPKQPYKSKSKIAFEKRLTASKKADKAEPSSTTATAAPKMGNAQPSFMMMMAFLGVIPHDIKLNFNMDTFCWELPANSLLPSTFNFANREKIASAIGKMSSANNFNAQLKILLEHGLISENVYQTSKERETDLSLSAEDQSFLASLEIEGEVNAQQQDASKAKKSPLVFDKKRVVTSNESIVRRFHQPEYESLHIKATKAETEVQTLLKEKFSELNSPNTDKAMWEQKIAEVLANPEQNPTIVAAIQFAEQLLLASQQAYDKEQQPLPQQTHLDSKSRAPHPSQETKGDWKKKS